MNNIYTQKSKACVLSLLIVIFLGARKGIEDRLSWKISSTKENLNDTSILIPFFPLLFFIPRQVYLPVKQN